MIPEDHPLMLALHADPSDDLSWAALADLLEETGRGEQAALMRLHRSLRSVPEGADRLARSLDVIAMLKAGVRPVWPTLTNSLGTKFALIPPGAFLMGADAKDEAADADERPQHRVEITRAFYLATTPLTEEGNRPRGGMSHATAEYQVPFLGSVLAERDAGRRYRLPTEAEWEYACRAWLSPSLPYACGWTLTKDDACIQAEGPCEVARYAPNPFGLFDMHGLVFEWCADNFDRDFYAAGAEFDPVCVRGSGEGYILRGGSYRHDAHSCRASYRNYGPRDNNASDHGVRPVLVPRR